MKYFLLGILFFNVVPSFASDENWNASKCSIENYIREKALKEIEKSVHELEQGHNTSTSLLEKIDLNIDSQMKLYRYCQKNTNIQFSSVQDKIQKLLSLKKLAGCYQSFNHFDLLYQKSLSQVIEILKLKNEHNRSQLKLSAVGKIRSNITSAMMIADNEIIGSNNCYDAMPEMKNYVYKTREQLEDSFLDIIDQSLSKN